MMSAVIEMVRGIADIADKSELADSVSLPAFEFRQEWGECATHGRFALNFWDGKRETWRPDNCPACARQARANVLMMQASIPPILHGCDFDGYTITTGKQAQIFDRCRQYAELFTGDIRQSPSIIMHGKPGTGKNHLSTAIVRRVLVSGYSALHLPVVDYMEGYWGRDFSIRPRWIDEMSRVDLLVLDELGRSSDTKSANDALFRLIDARWKRVKPTILISNMGIDGIKEAIGAAAYDRMRDYGGRRYEFDWESHRVRKS